MGAFVKGALGRLRVAPAEPAVVLLTSCDPGDTGGLRDLVETYQVRVVAPAEGLSAIKELCPQGTAFLPAEDLSKEAGVSLKALTLRGRGAALAAYLLSWHGKTVLITGKIPVPVGYREIEWLYAELSQSRTDTVDFLVSVHALDALKPDLWLPASPSNGQNANLYANEWKDTLEKNYGTAALILRRFEMGLNRGR